MAEQKLVGEVMEFRSRCFFKRKRCHMRKKAQQMFSQTVRKQRSQQERGVGEIQGTCSIQFSSFLLSFNFGNQNQIMIGKLIVF